MEGVFPMKLVRNIALSTLALTITLSAFAADKSLTLHSNTTLNGQKVAAGEYKVHYQINGSTADVKLMNGKNVVASATGQVVEKESPVSDTAIVKTQNPDGSSSIVELQLEKQKSVIRFAPEGSEKGK
jgi:hypothetical protein